VRNSSRPRSLLLDILFFPFGCLIQTPPLILVALVAGALAVFYIFQGGAFISFGSVRPNFRDYQINENYTRVQRSDGAYWTISYEKPNYSVFTGLVRYTTEDRENNFPLLTHDILVTSGDFADPEIVHTDVREHHFTWTSPKNGHPQGTINLLHTIPLNEEIYQQLLQVKDGELVTISGPEVLRMDAYQPDGKLIAWWQDSGCNSMIVTAVQIQPNP
jgi:hypothetical protein